ncbi:MULTISPECIES: tripartite tricarboxylate transporter substrate binding protein [unclassified Marinobacter]|uniref:tripartite tricarboxylate transporter substrate binding protein n=1 Tax=unclassified Marinobacter TaxID=83889 RepID=UPI00200F6861|nr:MULTISPECIES: tripartite tricarboxylate transporter substrate binding protein [unclassified Marinobacter]MCL1478397.1 tripartite tricarboxylate transporter substrate binding protein [Marinobacter sp.]MCL1480353.1 tripartite tricarboxylate transporter substrate binding protein [Marinobacter sp.]MCL1483779.1 tripartite tricarboxylate transporter substrate binding protein [Marinobacter sp.]MCL1487371.1 tripartite tricarboxylate transporter substrate binding protein [Marinobacter sp.]UQG55437.1
MKNITKFLAVATLAISPLLVSSPAMAEYPERPVKFVVPWPPGDLEDIITRVIAEKMLEETGTPASVINKPGGGGIVGALDVAKARPNGQTIGSFVADILTTHIHSGNAPYDQSTFEPVGIFLDYPFVIAANSDAPYNNMAELAKYSQDNDISLGHFGYQALPTAITFKAASEAGIRIASDAAFDATNCITLATGDADIINTTTQLILSCLKSGEVKLLTSLTKDRLTIAPEVATLAEQTGITQTTWNGLFVRKGTSDEIKNKIAVIAQAALDSDRIRQLAESTGAGIYWIGGEEAEALVAKDFESSKGLLEFMNR